MKTKLKKKLIYSAILTVIPAILLLALTLGWFTINDKIEAESMFFQSTGPSVQLLISVDEDNNGLPDTELIEGTETVKFVPFTDDVLELKHIYPGYTVMIKVVSLTPLTQSGLSGKLEGISGDTEDADEPGGDKDTAKAVRIKYIDPVNDQEISTSLYKAMEDPEDPEKRNVTILNDYMTAQDNYEFVFTLYMAKRAEREYYNKSLTIDRMAFFAANR